MRVGVAVPTRENRDVMGVLRSGKNFWSVANSQRRPEAKQSVKDACA